MIPEPLLLVGMEHRKPNHFGCLRQKVTSYRKWEGVKHERQGTPLHWNVAHYGQCMGSWLLWLSLGTMNLAVDTDLGIWPLPWVLDWTHPNLFSRISAWKYPPWVKNIEQVEPHSIFTWWPRSLGSVDLNWPPFAGQGRRGERYRLRKQICNAGHIPDFCLPSPLRPLRLPQLPSRSWSSIRWQPVLLSGFL